MMTKENSVSVKVKEYYGKILKSKEDLKTNACCTGETVPEHLRPHLKKIHPEVTDRFYGCGSPIPEVLSGRTVLDLGCGTGRDVYLLSALVGESGRVIGVDMTSEQLAVAKRHLDYHRQAWGHQNSNVEFRQGYMEDLASLNIADHSVDVVVSNCVINLAPQKEEVFREIFRILKPGGELYFSDVFAGRRIPEDLKHDPVLVGECLAGALYLEDFRRLLLQMGCSDYRVVSQSALALNDADVQEKIGKIDFHTLTVRAFNLPLEDRCEDYGQVATYLGNISEFPHAFTLDDHHVFERGRPMLVCSNTAAMLTQTRLAPHFKVEGDCSTHFGLFDCSTSPAQESNEKFSAGCC